jgi:hypothetical protein
VRTIKVSSSWLKTSNKRYFPPARRTNGLLWNGVKILAYDGIIISNPTLIMHFQNALHKSICAIIMFSRCIHHLEALVPLILIIRHNDVIAAKLVERKIQKMNESGSKLAVHKASTAPLSDHCFEWSYIANPLILFEPCAAISSVAFVHWDWWVTRV